MGNSGRDANVDFQQREKKEKVSETPKEMKKIRKMKQKIANYLYPIEQRFGGAVAIGTGLVGIRLANGDGEILFCALFLILIGTFILFTRKNVFDYDEYEN